MAVTRRGTLAHHDGCPKNGYDGLRSPGDRRRLHHGRSRMNRICTAFAALALSGAFSVAHAVPPTVTPSPGYDARLQEQRKAASGSPVMVQPAAPFTAPTA